MPLTAACWALAAATAGATAPFSPPTPPTPPLRTLADVRDALGNHTLFKAMGAAADWLARHQITTPALPPTVCPQGAKPISDWRGAFVGDYDASRRAASIGNNGGSHSARRSRGVVVGHGGGGGGGRGDAAVNNMSRCLFTPPMGPFWHVGQAAKALSLAADAPVPDGVPPGHAAPSQASWRASAALAGGFLLRQIRADGLVVGALENNDVFPQTSTAVEGLGALFVLANATARAAAAAATSRGDAADDATSASPSRSSASGGDSDAIDGNDNTGGSSGRNDTGSITNNGDVDGAHGGSGSGGSDTIDSDPNGYAAAGVRSATWYASHAWARGEGLMWDFWNTSSDTPVTSGFEGYCRLPLPQVPGTDDGALLDAWVAAGRPSAAASPLLAVFNGMLDRQLRDEHPPGNWDAYLLCDGRSDVLCHRRAYWWGIPFLRSFELTGNTMHLAAAERVGLWYTLAQRLDGGVFRQTTAAGVTPSYGLANSAAAAAVVVWARLFRATGDTQWLEPTLRSMRFLLTQQVKNATDPDLEGAVIEYVTPPPSGTDAPPWVVRDIAPSFFVHAAATVLRLAAEGA